MTFDHLLSFRNFLFAAMLLCLLASGGCNKQDSSSTADASADDASQLTAVGDVGATQDDIIIPSDTEVTIVVDYHGWDVNSDGGDPKDREHVFSVLATWGTNLHEELRELVIREGESDSTTLDIGDGQVLTISPRWNERQRGSYLFQIKDVESGNVIAAFDARDTGEIASMTTPARHNHHAKTVFADLDKRVYLQEVKCGGPQDFTRTSEFGLAYIGEGFKDMPVCKVNDNHHWHFPRFEVVACPREWMANYSFKGLGEKLSRSKTGVDGEGGVRRINWEAAYSSQRRAQRSCMSGG